MLISWLEKAGYQNIIICDNQSTYEPMLDYLAKTNHTVFNSEHNSHLSPWINGLVEKYGKNNHYVVTDSDVLPDENCPHNVIDFFSYGLERFPFLRKIGLSLLIDDIPDCYLNKEKVKRWEGQFWGAPVDDLFYNAPVDTTFALYRAGSQHNISESFRSAPPYSARHLPWYSDSSNPTEEELFYFKNASPDISTWTNEPVKQSHIV